jgi:hypothetical protein
LLKANFISIYRLVDPLTDKVRYVGATSRTVELRLEDHLHNARGKERRHVCNWVRSLLQKGALPRAELIEKAPYEQWAKREAYWVSFYRACGFDLTNLTGGGEGMHNPTPELREKISAATKRGMNNDEVRQKLSLAAKKQKREPMSEETRKKLSAALTGKVFTPERCRNISIGRSGIPHTEETKQKIRATMNTPEAKEFFGNFRKGTKLTDEHKNALLKAITGRPVSQETRLKISESNKGKKLTESQLLALRKPCPEERKLKISLGLKRYFEEKKNNEPCS